MAARIGYPVVLKAQAQALSHKSDAGGVVLDLGDEAALSAGWARFHADVARHAPGLAPDGVLVEAMGERGVELIVGARNDPEWRPVILVGFGGVQAEILKDVRLLPPDLPAAAIEAELRALKGGALLDGWRGAVALDSLILADWRHGLSRSGEVRIVPPMSISTARSQDIAPDGPVGLGMLGDLAGYHLRRASGAMGEDFHRALAGTGMRQVLFGILSVVRANPSVNQGVVGRALGIQRANMVALITQLVEADLLDRRAAANDRRAFALLLTAKGEATMRDCDRRIAAHEEAMLADLSATERRTLIELLGRIEARGR